MIQFNLLPAVKVEYLKTKKLKRKILLYSGVSIIVSALISIVLYSVVFITQPRRLDSLDKSIKTLSGDIKAEKDINKILTIQNQLSAVDTLHNSKPAVMRLFTYITQITPSPVSVQSFNVSFNTSKIEVSGQAPSIEEMNKFIDTLKFTTINFGEEGSDNTKKAFSQVVLSSYAINEKGAGFKVVFNYEPDIFLSDKEKLKLEVPKITSTRSATERPSDLFKVNETPTGEEPSDE